MSVTNHPLVFTDFHHAGLLQSLIILFEDRLEGQVYRPIGMDWATKGYWKIYDHPATQQQFLTLDQGYRPIDGSPPLNLIKEVGRAQVGEAMLDGEIYYCRDIDSNTLNKAITYDTFMSLPIDIVIASIPQHIDLFRDLTKMHPNHPKLIFQIGNSWVVEAGTAPNIMASAIIHNVPETINFISYHQEFSLDTFYPHFPHQEYIGDAHCKCLYHSPGPNIYSFVNCFNIASHHVADWQIFQEVEKLMPGWDFKSYGGQCRDGAAHGTKEVAKKIRQSRFVWHVKNGGDGYGHILFNSAACARPIIVKKSYYQDKMGEKLMRDGETCINIDGLGPLEIAEKIRYYSEPTRYNQMCRTVYDNFKSTVDFNLEETKMREFLAKLL